MQTDAEPLPDPTDSAAQGRRVAELAEQVAQLQRSQVVIPPPPAPAGPAPAAQPPPAGRAAPKSTASDAEKVRQGRKEQAEELQKKQREATVKAAREAKGEGDAPGTPPSAPAQPVRSPGGTVYESDAAYKATLAEVNASIAAIAAGTTRAPREAGNGGGAPAAVAGAKPPTKRS